jgi:hypothetical protein
MKKIIIIQKQPWHYEVVLNVIEKYNEIIKKDKEKNDIIFLVCALNESFFYYIRTVYPFIQFCNKDKDERHIDYDYYINCTSRDEPMLLNDGKHFYIFHDIFETSQKNILFLTPLHSNLFVCDVVPFQNCIEDDPQIPIYIVQGSESIRRNFDLIQRILEKDYEYEFKIKIIGKEKIPESIEKHEKVITKYNLNYVDYHQQFLNCYAILPLVSKEKQPRYYTTAYTSTIMYGLGYKLNFIIDKDLQDIYHLDNVYVYSDENDIVESFTKSLYDFYHNRRYKCPAS